MLYNAGTGADKLSLCCIAICVCLHSEDDMFNGNFEGHTHLLSNNIKLPYTGLRLSLGISKYCKQTSVFFQLEQICHADTALCQQLAKCTQ